MRLTVHELNNYAFCPILFKIMPTGYLNDLNIDKHYYSSLVRTIKQIHIKQLESEKNVKWEEVINKWNKNWWASRDPDVKDDRDTCNNGYMALMEYYNNHINSGQETLVVNFPFNIPIKDDIISGSIPVIGYDITTGYITCFVFNQYVTSQEILIRSIEAMAISYVINDSFKDRKKVEIRNYYYSKPQGKFYSASIYPNIEYAEAAMEVMKALLLNIKHDIVYPNTYACKQCILYKKCIKEEVKNVGMGRQIG